MTLIDTFVAQPPPPIRMDDDGVARVGGTRVTLESVVIAFNNGCAAEEILLKYTSLKLKDIYSVINYYLGNKADVDSYLAERSATGAEVRHELDARFPAEGNRERLFARSASTALSREDDNEQRQTRAQGGGAGG